MPKNPPSLEEALAMLDLPSSRAERETIICRAADQKYWSICTSDPTMIRKCWKAFGPGVRIDRGTLEWCNVPKTYVSIRTHKQKELLPSPKGCGDPKEPSCMSWAERKKLNTRSREQEALRRAKEQEEAKKHAKEVEEARKKVKAAAKSKAPAPPADDLDIDDLLDDL